MSTFEPARPRYQFTFVGKEYTLLGTMETIEAVESALKEGILQITPRVVGMGAMDTAKLISALLVSNGYPDLGYRKVAQSLYELGINSDAFSALQIHLFAFLRIMIEPPELREMMAKRMGEVTGKLTELSASLGESTNDSA
jgi:hypothetical protein